MRKLRTDRLNSLLKEVISEVIRRDVHNPWVNELVTVTRVDITKDLHYAKVYISVIGDEKAKAETLRALTSAAGFIAVTSSKKIVIRYFPELTFRLDDGVEKHMRIEELLGKISAERKDRTEDTEETEDEEVEDEESELEEDEDEDEDEGSDDEESEEDKR